ncbi:hypothetical protein AVEN_43508-1 [Araneus ventricosus]|uniref:Uncharacterized protein n=1 Tax=Araneus ventricosus TaxID=182803 RepID=A0A4Y2F4X3_ARAVE|nr:hypothetical protein AVEN_43508-1 [Araneus ventricosus]
MWDKGWRTLATVTGTIISKQTCLSSSLTEIIVKLKINFCKIGAEKDLYARRRRQVEYVLLNTSQKRACSLWNEDKHSWTNKIGHTPSLMCQYSVHRMILKESSSGEHMAASTISQQKGNRSLR